jgi:uncharacterized DUF497 family protein
VKRFAWNDDKNRQLKAERGVSFEQVILHIALGGIVDVVEHHNPSRYPDQRIYIIEIDHYAYLVPFVESEHTVFLETIIPSRKATRRYLREVLDD